MATNTIDGEPISTAVTREFAGEERRFELRLGEIKALEQRAGAGIGEIYRRVAMLTFTVEDIRQTIKCGLIGGGAEAVEAEALVRAAVDGWPLNESHALANAILLACFNGMNAAGKVRGPRTEDAPATSDPSTSPGQPGGSIPERSIP